jgi:hypothetical protein
MTEQDDEAFATQCLSSLPQVEASAELLRRVAQIPIEHAREQYVPPLFAARHWVLGLLAATLLGVSAGWFTLQASSIDDGGELITKRDWARNEANDDASRSMADEPADEVELDGMLALAWGNDELLLDEAVESW